MKKNVIIGVLLCLNVLLMAALLFVWMNSRGPAVSADAGRAPVAQAEGSVNEQTVTLQAGEHLNGDVAPQLAGRAITVSAIFDTQGSDGVVVARGGLAHGYALHVQDGELIWALRRNNALTTISGGKISAGRHLVAATLAQDGGLSLIVDGQAPAKGQLGGSLTLTPVDGLEAGADRGAPVGNYSVPNTFGGTIESVTVKTF